MKGIPSFWVDSAARIDVKLNKIQHKVSPGAGGIFEGESTEQNRDQNSPCLRGRERRAERKGRHSYSSRSPAWLSKGTRSPLHSGLPPCSSERPLHQGLYPSSVNHKTRPCPLISNAVPSAAALLCCSWRTASWW